MKTSSAKAKGRRAQQEAIQVIMDYFSSVLSPDDVISRSMGASGEDIIMSPKARSVLPLSIEVKNTEKINIWDAFEQAKSNAGKNTPAVVFKRNKSNLMICLEFNRFINFMRLAYESTNRDPNGSTPLITDEQNTVGGLKP